MKKINYHFVETTIGRNNLCAKYKLADFILGEKRVAKEITIPIIGIGAGRNVDGQVLVLHDLIGMTKEFNPRFLRRYMNLHDDIITAISSFSEDIKSGDFPNKNEQY